MAYKLSFQAAAGSVLHAKPEPATTPWADDAIALSETSPGVFTATTASFAPHVVYYGLASVLATESVEARRKMIAGSVESGSVEVTAISTSIKTKVDNMKQLGEAITHTSSDGSIAAKTSTETRSV